MGVEEMRPKACCTDAATDSSPSRCELPLRWPGGESPYFGEARPALRFVVGRVLTLNGQPACYQRERNPVITARPGAQIGHQRIRGPGLGAGTMVGATRSPAGPVWARRVCAPNTPSGDPTAATSSTAGAG